MSDCNETILSRLLQLNAGLLDDSETRQLRQQIADDPRLQTRWNQLREHGFESEESFTGSTASKINAEVIGAFVERRLGVETTRRLERQAWQDKALLREIVIAWQRTHLSGADRKTEAEPGRLQIRVRSMLEDAASSTTATNETETIEKPDLFVPPTSPDVSTLKPWHLAGAASLLVVATLGLIYMASINASGENRISQDPPPQQRDEAKAEEEAGPQSNEQNRFESSLAEERGSAEELLIGPPYDLVVPDDITEPTPPRRRRDAVVKNHPPERPRTVYQAIRPEWDRYEGVICVRDSSNDVTQGLGNVDVITNEMAIQVLPGSWAECNVSRLGRLVVDGDSEFQIGTRTWRGESRSLDRSRVEIAMEYGRVAVTDAEEDARFLISTGEAKWPITVTKKNTSLGIEYSNGIARVFVRKGAIATRGKELNHNQQIFLRQGRLGNPAQTRVSAKWMDRPQRGVKIPARFQTRLFESRDIDATLRILTDQVNDSRLQLAMAHWRWTLQPDLVLTEFRSRDKGRWSEALNWLTSHPFGTERSRNVWRMMNEATGNSDFVRALNRWSVLASRGELPTPEQVDQMTGFLANDRLFVRFASAWFLENYFGNPFGYKADAAAAHRTHRIRSWRQHIAETLTNLYRQRARD